MRILVIAACLAAPVSVGAAPVGTKLVLDRSVAHVDDAVIWEHDLDARAHADPAQRAAILDEMIDEELIVAEARRAGITVDQPRSTRRGGGCGDRGTSHGRHCGSRT